MKILYRPSSMITKDDITKIDESLCVIELTGIEVVQRRCSLRSVIDVIDLVVTTIQEARSRGFKTNRVMFSWGVEEIRQTMYQRFFISEHNYQHLRDEEIISACSALHDLNLIKMKKKEGVVCLVLSEHLEYLVSGEHHEHL